MTTTAHPHRLSIIVPTVGRHADCPLPASYLASGIAARLDVQFVFMLNAKVPAPHSEVTRIDNVETILVGNDRYFGACEENIYRVQDVARLLRDYVLIIGEHDAIDWESLCAALDMASLNKLEMLGINVLGRQQKADLSYSELPGITALSHDCSAALLARHLLMGGIVDGALGLAAIFATYGQVDWAAFVGSHLYTRQSLMSKRSCNCFCAAW
jgi:hypothetical protein